MSNPIVTINLVVLNGEKYIRHCLDGILGQAYSHEYIEFNILDNGSFDNTNKLIQDSGLLHRKSEFSKFALHESKVNLGMWPGQEELLKYSGGKYILAMAVDVILDKNFIKNAVETMESDEKIGGLEAKIYRYELRITKNELGSENYNSKFIIHNSNIIDTCGFQISKSRRITNIGHGEEDIGQYDGLGEIFGVEGAAPFFRRVALDDCAIEVGSRREIIDHDYFWYGDDLDLAWRMNLFGWKQICEPSVVAWHDRQTTKSLKKNLLDYIFRVPIRHQIPIRKRRLDWRNTRFTFIKNEYIINALKDSPFIVVREIAVLGYTLFFEPKVLLEVPEFLRLLPRMLKKRKEIFKRAKKSPKQIHKWFK